jgi:hypothetical protein
MAEVLGSTEFEEWFLGLGSAEARAVVRGVGLLEAKGPALGFPHCSALAGSRYALRELRVQCSGRPLRIVYAFDPERQAVLILGGDKTGDDRFYLKMIPRAETIWERYLEEFR